ncbi:hypothetical protein AIOL_003467 [Candidatus Rhodobacter oscarellae]|uniref:Uncharacterized protein n=1 Tax=Candidatus Rhodobacter oscarellae TaxID=1675527 RepID=A0A0J9E722_9RHOB|nr:hypothetical protein [Candidatus Rhodobacter lobularis]KMW58492.1 hypothetical protein AIOL_003467 [Candidatus Rhodobacter lobularis]
MPAITIINASFESSYDGDCVARITNDGRFISQTTAETQNTNVINSFNPKVGEGDDSSGRSYTANIFAGTTLIGTTTGHQDRFEKPEKTDLEDLFGSLDTTDGSLNGTPARTLLGGGEVTRHLHEQKQFATFCKRSIENTKQVRSEHPHEISQAA